MRPRRAWLHALPWAALSLLAAVPAGGQSRGAADAAALGLDIHPTTIALDDTAGHATIWLHNTTAHGWQGQARLYQWDQDDCHEHLQAATDVVASPALLDIAPGQRQRLRLVRPGAAPTEGEHAYRLLLVPAATAVDRTRYSLPVFAQAGARPHAPLQVALAPDCATAGDVALQLRNDSQAGVQVADLFFIDAQGRRQPVIDGLAGYVLAHRQRRWALPPRGDRYAGGQFHARLDGGDSAPLPSDAAPIAAPLPAGL